MLNFGPYDYVNKYLLLQIERKIRVIYLPLDYKDD